MFTQHFSGDVVMFVYPLILLHVIFTTLPETNIAPENRPSQEETSIPTIHFQGLC